MEVEDSLNEKTLFECKHICDSSFLVFNDMRVKGEQVDCYLLGEDGGPIIPCHKLVLSSVSPYFRTMFRHMDQVLINKKECMESN